MKKLCAPARNWAKAFNFGRLTRFMTALSAAVVAVAFLAWPAYAGVAEGKRVALVIGNGAYENAPKLDNPAPDARAVAGAFRQLGFEVIDG